MSTIPTDLPGDSFGEISGPGGPLPSELASTHPRWCRQETCTPAEHRGRLIEIRAKAADQAPVRLQLRQRRLPDAQPVIVVGDDAVVMSIRQARAVAHSTSALARVAERALA